jgi:hypothetical protein
MAQRWVKDSEPKLVENLGFELVFGLDSEMAGESELWKASKTEYLLLL